MATFTFTQIVLMVGMLVTGSITTLCKKAQNDCVVAGYKSKPHSFNHPWFQSWMLSLAQTLCLIGLPIQRRRELQKFRKEQIINDVDQHTEPIIEVGPPVHPRLCQWILIIPSCCSLLAVSLAGIGLLYVDASIMLMLKGSVIIFTGIFSKLFLKRDLKLQHWIGIVIVIAGLVLAGCSSVFKNQDHKTINGKAVTGIILILCGQILQGGQFVLEESVLKRRNLHPLHCVGIKGMYGFILMSFLVLPILYFIPGDNVGGSFENSIDALYQISNSYLLLTLCLLYTVSVGLLNYFSMAVVKSLTAVHSTLIDACRTAFVWGVGLTIFYGFDKNFGEPFDKSYGLLQIDGFMCIMIGTAIYKQLLDIRNFVPCKKWPKPKDEQNCNYSIRREIKNDNENERLLKGKR